MSRRLDSLRCFLHRNQAKAASSTTPSVIPTPRPTSVPLVPLLGLEDGEAAAVGAALDVGMVVVLNVDEGEVLNIKLEVEELALSSSTGDGS